MSIFFRCLALCDCKKSSKICELVSTAERLQLSIWVDNFFSKTKFRLWLFDFLFDDDSKEKSWIINFGSNGILML